MRGSGAASAAMPRPMQWSFPPWFLPFWIGAVGWQWWRLCLRELELLHPAGGPLGAAALAALAGRASSLLIESGFYVFLWAGLGHRLRFWRFASWLVSISMLEVLAESSRLDRRLQGGGTLLDAVLLGPVALHALRSPAATWLVAFGSLGLTTLFRIGWTALIQARALGLRLGWPLAATLATWIIGHAALWMVAELMRGRSVPS